MIDYIRAALNGQAQERELPFVIHPQERHGRPAREYVRSSCRQHALL